MGSAALLAVGPGGWVEHDDLADMGRVKRPVHQDSLTFVQRWLHRSTRDLVGLDRPGLDCERQTEGHHDGHDELEQTPHASIEEHD